MRPISDTRLYGLDALRFLTAVGVMVAHFGEWHYQDLTPAWRLLGALCVNIFFVISGLVIMRSVEAAPSNRKFLARRASRLYPAFIICFLFALMVKYVDHQTVSLLEILGNLTMLPRLLRIPEVNSAYWTLSCEWSFYLMVAATFFVIRRFPISVIIFWIITGLATRIGGATNPVVSILLNSNMAPLFAAGMVIHLVRSRDMRAATYALVVVVMVLASIGGTWGGPPWPGLGLSAAYLLLFAVCVGPVIAASALRLPPRFSRLALVGGAASYPLYLIHVPVAALITPPLVALGFGSGAIMVSFMFAAIMISLAISQKLEGPVRKMLTDGIGRARLIYAVR